MGIDISLLYIITFEVKWIDMTSQKLTHQIKQSLKLNASLAQSLKTLQLSSDELENFIEEKLIENPFLEKDETPIIQENYEKPLYDRRIDTRNYEYDDYNFLDFVESKISLREHIITQLNCEFNNKSDKLIARFLTDYLSDDGYLKINKTEICNFLKIDITKLEEIIVKLKSLDPIGVFSENLSECLKIQLKEKNILDKKYEIIIDNLNLIALGEIDKLAKMLNIHNYDLISRIQFIKKLEPKPGRNYSNEILMPKIPDVEINVNEENKITITSRKSAFRFLKISQEYNSEILKNANEEDKKYISEKVKEANNIVKSVEMRKKTIIQVAEVIAKEQEDFFKRGIMYLKPLTLSKVASQIGYDESTISRATSNKFIETPFGIVDMRFFFSSGVKSKYSNLDISSIKVKEIIKSLINDEDKNNPLSDDEISSLLKNFNIIAARRTVAKYRDSLKISPSSKRKREYSLSHFME